MSRIDFMVFGLLAIAFIVVAILSGALDSLPWSRVPVLTR
jgi:hypothetical protein